MAQIETKKTTTKKIVVKKTTTPVVVKPEIKKIETKWVKFSHSNLKVSPRKLRLLVATVKKLTPAVALNTLQFTNSNSARLLREVLNNAINTAKNNNQLLVDSLKFASVTVDEGQKIKRMDKSHGSRFARGMIMRRHSRLNIVLSGTIAG